MKKKKNKTKMNKTELKRNYRTVAKSKSALELLEALNDNMNWYLDTSLDLQKLANKHREIQKKKTELEKLKDDDLKSKIKELDKESKKLIEKYNQTSKTVKKREIELEVYQNELSKKLGVELNVRNVYNIPYALFQYFEERIKKNKKKR